MKRSQFLALIPSIAAMPLLAREIIQDKEKVTIWKPEPVKIETPSILDRAFDLRNCEVKLLHNGQEIGSGYLTELNSEYPMHEVSTNDNFGTRHYVAGSHSITISAQLYNFHL